jgi:3D-(3,5/4)-trihydroxycyclohexane-1,2-dione acylhydrolase (decyclizing)
LSDFTTGSQSAFRNPNVKFVGINVSGHDAYKQGALPLVADAREALRELMKVAQDAGVEPDPTILREVAEAKSGWDTQLEDEVYRPVPGEAMSQALLIQAINREARDGDTIVAAAGTPPGDLLKLWDASGGRRCHLEFGYSCMGYELPAGLGVRMAQPAGEVYVFIGDGTYLMNPTELVTAAQEGLKVTVIVSENHGFQSIHQLQMYRGGRNFATEFRGRDAGTGRLDGDYIGIDFAKNAESFGARVWSATTPEEVADAMREARGATGPCVIVAETEPHRYLPSSGMWWDIAPAEVSGDPVTQAARAAYEEENKWQRLHH